MAEICKWKFFKRFEYKKRKKKKNPCGREKGCGRGRETTNFFLDIINKMYCTVVMRQSIYTVNIPLPSAYTPGHLNFLKFCGQISHYTSLVVPGLLKHIYGNIPHNAPHITEN
jgi:hypothetical protein